MSRPNQFALIKKFGYKTSVSPGFKHFPTLSGRSSKWLSYGGCPTQPKKPLVTTALPCTLAPATCSDSPLLLQLPRYRSRGFFPLKVGNCKRKCSHSFTCSILPQSCHLPWAAVGEEWLGIMERRTRALLCQKWNHFLVQMLCHCFWLTSGPGGKFREL